MTSVVRVEMSCSVGPEYPQKKTPEDRNICLELIGERQTIVIGQTERSVTANFGNGYS